MRVFIPYKNEPLGGLECKFTIRSMVKHFKDMTGVIIVGDKPAWYTGDHIQYGDIENRKEYSIYRKLLLLKETVLHCNDDMYMLRDFDSGLPNYCSGTCGERNLYVQDKTYKELYLNCPSEWKNFDIHCPMVIDTTKFGPWLIDMPLKTAYANYNKLEGVEAIDCKPRGNPSYNEVCYHIAGKKFFSSADNANTPGMLRVLNKLFPNKSKYEL